MMGNKDLELCLAVKKEKSTKSLHISVKKDLEKIVTRKSNILDRMPLM